MKETKRKQPSFLLNTLIRTLCIGIGIFTLNACATSPTLANQNTSKETHAQADLKTQKDEPLLLDTQISESREQNSSNIDLAKGEKEPSWRFYIGGELGLGASHHASIVPVPYNDRNSIYIDNQISKDDDDRESEIRAPIGLRLGISGGHKFFWSVGALYLRYDRSMGADRIKCTGSSSGTCPQDVEAKIENGVSYKNEMLGADVRLGIGNGGNGGLYIGGGMLWDLRSRVSGFSGDLAFSREIKGHYPFSEFGIIIMANKMFFDLSYRYIFRGEKHQDWANLGSLNIALGLAI